ncbi:Agamous-like MADS-box protein AGL65 [Bienertia sinuspersici]
MVRPRITLEKLNGELSRTQYYMHNKSIVSTKVREMSVLTGSDIFFLQFSPSGIPSLHLGQHRQVLLRLQIGRVRDSFGSDFK